MQPLSPSGDAQGVDLKHIFSPNPIMLLLLSEEDYVILTRLEEDMWREVTRFDTPALNSAIAVPHRILTGDGIIAR